MQDVNNSEISAALVQDLLKEKRRDRRWRNIRSLLWLVFSVFVFISFMGGWKSLTRDSSVSGISKDKYTALIRVDGMIAPGREFSGNEFVETLKDAFSDKNAEGVIIDINSPGGTPVQSAIIHDAILKFKKQYKKKVVVVGEDMLTSGAYYVAVAADKIYVNPNTITGSIGVIIKGFGFVDVMKKLGVERRVYTAGSNKDRLDPFLPQNPDDERKIQEVMGEVHKNFMNAVLEGRKGKIKTDRPDLFTGDFWAGQTALELGLVDGLGNLLDTMEKEFHTTEYKEYSTGSGLMRFLTGQMGTSIDKLFYS